MLGAKTFLSYREYNISFFHKTTICFQSRSFSMSLVSPLMRDILLRPLKPEPWGNISFQKSFMENLAKKLSIGDQAGWYKLTPNILIQHGGYELIQIYKQPRKLLETIYPEYLAFRPGILHFEKIRVGSQLVSWWKKA